MFEMNGKMVVDLDEFEGMGLEEYEAAMSAAVPEGWHVFTPDGCYHGWSYPGRMGAIRFAIVCRDDDPKWDEWGVYF